MGKDLPMTILGAVALPSLPPERLPKVAAAADAAGLEELWLWEDCFYAGGIAAAGVALARTQRLRVGIGVLPVPLRAVSLAAMELAALERIAPGRLVPGLGHGVQVWMGQVGVRVASPLTLLREYTAALRALLVGDEVTTQDNRYVRLDHVRLAWPPPTSPALHIGTEGPRSLRLSGELADGTILTGGTTPDAVRRARGYIEEGRWAAGRPREHRITVYLRAATGPDAAQRLETDARRWELDPATQAEDAGIAGDAEAIAAAVRRWAAAGADAVILQPTEDDPDPEAFVRFAATEVAPLLR
jgi:alkanesulfonate monooxygenase SsuD/methylene tetrahydromethanopterin reductase-like flavin-dependent oxidoreductase (luciferase family)